MEQFHRRRGVGAEAATRYSPGPACPTANLNRHFLFAFLGLLICCASYPAAAASWPAPSVPFYGYATPEKIGGDFELIGSDAAGEHTISLRQYRGKFVLLLFGFTHCPLTCPTTLSRAAEVVAAMEDRNDLAVIFVTLDPERDQPGPLNSFIQSFNKDFIGLSGSAGQIQKVADAYRVSYAKQPWGKSYTIDHSSYIYLLDRAGQVAFLYPENEPASHISQDINNLLRK